MEVTLAANSVYRNGFIVEFSNGEGLLERDLVEFEGVPEDIYHEVKPLDRLDLLANRYYKARVQQASRYWWIIADANNIDNPLDLSDLVGTSILVPNILNALLTIQNT